MHKDFNKNQNKSNQIFNFKTIIYIKIPKLNGWSNNNLDWVEWNGRPMGYSFWSANARF